MSAKRVKTERKANTSSSSSSSSSADHEKMWSDRTRAVHERHNRHGCRLLRLADSLQSEILSYLDMRDIYQHVALCCKDFNALANDEHELTSHLRTLALRFLSHATDPNESANSLALFLSRRYQQTVGRFRLPHLIWKPRNDNVFRSWLDLADNFCKPRDCATLDPIYLPLQFLLRFLHLARGQPWFPTFIKLDWLHANFLTFETDRIATLLEIADVQAANTRASVAALWSVTDDTFGDFLQNYCDTDKKRMMQVRNGFPVDILIEDHLEQIYPTLILNDFTIRIDFATKFVKQEIKQLDFMGYKLSRRLDYVRYKIHSNANGRRICVCEWSDRVTKSKIAGPRECSKCTMPVSSSDFYAAS